MNGLPTIPLPSRSVTVEGVEVIFHALTRAECQHVQIGFHAADMTDLPDVEAKAEAAEVYILAHGLGVSEDDAKAWRDATDGDSVGKVVDGICILSGLSDAPNGGPSPQPSTSAPS